MCVRSDNSATIAAVNKGISKSRDLFDIIERLFFLSIRYNFKLSAVFLPCVDNILADRILILHELVSASYAQILLSNGIGNIISCSYHMSYCIYITLQEGWRTLSEGCLVLLHRTIVLRTQTVRKGHIRPILNLTLNFVWIMRGCQFLQKRVL